jgi:hypothetical protein
MPAKRAAGAFHVSLTLFIGAFCWLLNPLRLQLTSVGSEGCPFVCTWAQDERPADLHMAQPNVPVMGKTGHIPPARLVRGARAMQGDHTLATIGKLVVSI